MPDIFGLILWPIRWVIELILVGFHSLWTSLGMDGSGGWTWVLALLGLVVVVRSAMIPLTVRQIKSSRNMMMAAPEIKKIQDKYKGKRDQFSMEAMRRETTEVYARTGSSPMAGCWPILVQMPILMGLYNVINDAQHQKAGVGMLSQELAVKFSESSIFGAPLRATFQTAGENISVVVLAIVMIIVMAVSQFVTQRQIMSKNISEATKESPMYRQQQMMLYVLPLIFAVSGIFFPIGLMVYWLISNFWTIGQQWIVVRNMPTPGSEAAKAREARLRAKGKWVEEEQAARPLKGKKAQAAAEAAAAAAAAEEERRSRQRQQPVGKARAKKQKGKGGNAGSQGSSGSGASAAGSGGQSDAVSDEDAGR
ncbi:Membrane protein insertase YidC [Pseudoclavibacter triregionum]|nr:Membrane protein insertase YidC [Pseudoclavibacter triregionum]